MESKICHKCKIEKSVSEFDLNEYCDDGYLDFCKDCMKLVYIKYKSKYINSIKESRNKYYSKNKDKIIAKNKEWADKNKDKIRKRQHERYIRERDRLRAKPYQYDIFCSGY